MLPILKGVAPSWADISITANINGGTSIQSPDWKSIDWESKIDRGEQRGASGGRVLKRTTGQVTNTASAELYKSGLRDLKARLMAVAPVDSAGRPLLSKVSFDVIVKHSIDDDPAIYVVKLLGCHLDKTSGKHAEGTDPEVIGIDLNPIEIIEVIDGKDTVLL